MSAFMILAILTILANYVFSELRFANYSPCFASSLNLLLEGKSFLKRIASCDLLQDRLRLVRLMQIEPDTYTLAVSDKQR